jgi:mediator of RNA polymerase II transcription subunit 7
MAEQQQQQGPHEDDDLRIGFFPPPPPFWRNFTAENQAQLKDVEKEAGMDTTGGNDVPTNFTTEQILALPTELRYLIPPEPPSDDAEFKVFGTVARTQGGDKFTTTMEWISRTLAADYTLMGWEYEQLYPSTAASSSASSTLDRQRYLFRFLRSLLIAYIELLGIVAINPTAEEKDEKLKDILTMVTNMHALINEYRPHQARETLIREMERQVERKRAEVEGVRKMREKVKDVLEGFGKDVEKDEGAGMNGVGGPTVVQEDDSTEIQREVWGVMDEMILGH